MKLKDFTDITNNSVVVSIRCENENTTKYHGTVVQIPDALLERDIVSIDDAIDMSANTAVIVIVIKAVSYIYSLKIK